MFEKHPENAPPYDVLLSQLGTFQFQRKYPNGDPSGPGIPNSAYTKWTSPQLISVFKKSGLEVGNPRPMTKNDYGLAPMIAVEGTRFFIASLCADCGGRVLSFAKQEDLDATAKYYSDLGRSNAALFSWVHSRDNLLLQINGSLSEPKARAYAAALNNLADGYLQP